MMDWNSNQNHFFLNPKFPIDQSRYLVESLNSVMSSFKSHLFLLTSGTTAQSLEDLKWVALSKSAFLESAKEVNHHLQSSASDVWIHTLPEFHVGGLAIWARSHLSHASVFRVGRWNVQDFLESVTTHQGTLTSLVPAQVYDLVQAACPCPASLRAVVVGGGALSAALFQRIRELGWPVLPSYGMTEAASQIATANLDTSSVSGSPDMKVLSHMEVQVSSEGRLRLRGGALFTAYIYPRGLRKDKAQAEILDPKQEGWFVTEDYGAFLGGYLSVRGRGRDFLKIGGENVELGRLQEILSQACLELRVQADVALVPTPDARLSHVIHLISDRHLSLPCGEGLVELFNSKVLGFEKIRKWHRLEHIPRTALGKLLIEESLRLLMDLKGEDSPD